MNVSLADLSEEKGRKLDAEGGKTLSYAERIKFGAKLFQGGAMMNAFKYPEDARRFARDFMSKYFRSLAESGIEVNFNNLYSQDTEGLMLYLCNHQIFGIEALAAFNLAGVNARVLLKDELLQIPIFGSGLSRIDPIVFERASGKLSEIKKINEQIRSTISDRLQPVLVFPEGTRSDDGGLLEFHTVLYNAAVNAIKKNPQMRQAIGVITADTHVTFPYKLSPKLLYQFDKKARRTPINFQLDILEIDPEENIKALNERIRQIIEENLRGFLLEK